MWKLPIIKNDSYNCFQYLVVTVAECFNCDYRLMMLELWGFSYDIFSGPAIGDKLKLCWNSKVENRKKLLQYHGITFKVKKAQNLILNQYIGENMEKNPVAIYVDSFMCSWLPFYQKMHRPHAFFIVEKGKNNYYILDQYCIDGVPQMISQDFVERNTTSVITFAQDNENRVDVIKYIGDSLGRWEKYGFEQYESFIADMKSNLDIRMEIKDDPVSSKIVMYLKNLSEDRHNFIETICLFEKLFSRNMNLAKDKLLEISNRYQKLRSYLIKCAILHKEPKVDIISNEMECIFEAEIVVYKDIKDLYNEEQSKILA